MKHAWVLDTFDTRIFGFPIAKITNITIEKGKNPLKAVQELVQDLQENKIKYASYRLHAHQFSIIHALERSGFLLVDGLVSFEREITGEEKDTQTAAMRLATRDDSEELQQLAGESFISNRFYHDKIFKKYKKETHTFYAEWVENSINGKVADSVLVWEEEGKIIGFVSLQKNGHIPLLAVSEVARGKKISRKLLASSLAIFRKWGVKLVKIETVMTNVAALRAYEACGFRVYDTHLTFRWSKDD